MKKLLTLAAVLAVSAYASAADVDAGKGKAATCVACHGANGISMVPMYPNLAGQKEQYLVSALKAYKAQQRTGGNAPIMYGMVAPLSDDDIANLAAYFASLDPAGK
ncbi:MAG: cytochrome c [Reinekea sp.]|nr:cytochrome c [Reinekea sp.]